MGVQVGANMKMTSSEYLERATYCREQAKNAPDDSVRVGWLRLAEIWLVMANNAGPRTPEEFMQDLSTPKKNGNKARTAPTD